MYATGDKDILLANSKKCAPAGTRHNATMTIVIRRRDLSSTAFSRDEVRNPQSLSVQGVDRESGHDRSATFVGYLALSILGSCGGSLLAPDLLGCLRYTLGECFLMGVVAPLCGSWAACRRLSVVQLVR